MTPSRRNRIEHLLGQCPLGLGVLHVHDWRFARYRDRFGHGSDFQVHVHRRSKRAGQFDAFPLHRAESCQRKGDGVDAGPQIHDPILAGSISRNRPDFFNQGGAAGFDRDTGQDRSGRIFDHARNGRLGVGGGRQHEPHRDRDQHSSQRTHRTSLLLRVQARASCVFSRARNGPLIQILDSSIAIIGAWAGLSRILTSSATITDPCVLAKYFSLAVLERSSRWSPAATPQPPRPPNLATLLTARVTRSTTSSTGSPARRRRTL